MFKDEPNISSVLDVLDVESEVPNEDSTVSC